ncbi:acyl-CoA dehydrogenase family protein [Streptomyces sp. TS71-3]|uniref:acyl-CoA dehydrogenase family protein n=1 Tax=Streptomyces sp. TS71-3 TaxID=2733862 RepID=UPI001B093672|nr:acyl-CoA dehydrogenase family protein [Streptomyces sp. TS71-3]GHJ37535.1 acyl-CoA dehydrogenase [Streptomyces sp. TS71-3]
MPATHEVINQVPPLPDHNTADDPALLEALARGGADWAGPELRAAGLLAGSGEAREWARLANENTPVLHTHDRTGNRIDEVEYHPAWHNLMRAAVGFGLTGAAWQEERAGAHTAHAALSYAWGQVETGHMCPIGMTYSAVPTLRHSADLAERYVPLLASTDYQPGAQPPLAKRGLLAGMSMTEKQGGSDIRANSSRATPSADGSYRITGHKWFTSAPMCDVFLVLARAAGGLSCFLMPRILPDGTRNAIRLQRLKDKVGNRSNASAEVEYDGAQAWLIGEEGAGLKIILDMVNASRLHVSVDSASAMRAGTVAAVHHASHRRAFGAPLIDQPLMRNVLADLALESEAALALVMRIAQAADGAQAGSDSESAFRRIGVALCKYWVPKRTPAHAAEALECLGGNGYVEESGLGRLYREAPLNSIWEGSGNVVALDVLRALRRAPQTADAFLAELDTASGADHRYDRAVHRLRTRLSGLAAGPEADMQFDARRTAEAMAITLQASLLLRHGHPAVADAFCASRLDGDGGHAFGTLPASADTKPIIERARVARPGG